MDYICVALFLFYLCPVQAEIGIDIEKAADLLRAGELVGIPTETVYGLAGNALNDRAVSRIFRVKERPNFDPLIIHVATPDHIAEWVQSFPPLAEQLAQAFLPGPLTLLLPKEAEISDLVTAGSAHVAIRVPAHPMARDLLARLNFPLAAPSANPFGYISPTTARHVAQQLGDRIPYILDGGACHIGMESTIVAVVGDQVTVLRKGGITVEEIEQLIGPVQVADSSSSNPQAPGMLQSHYAPRKPIRIGTISELLAEYVPTRVGILSFADTFVGVPAPQQVVLSKERDLLEAARRFFAAMRYLDDLDIDIILAEWLPEVGLGRAVNDRLRRAGAGE